MLSPPSAPRRRPGACGCAGRPRAWPSESWRDPGRAPSHAAYAPSNACRVHPTGQSGSRRASRSQRTSAGAGSACSRLNPRRDAVRAVVLIPNGHPVVDTHVVIVQAVASTSPARAVVGTFELFLFGAAFPVASHREQRVVDSHVSALGAGVSRRSSSMRHAEQTRTATERRLISQTR